MIIFVFTKLKIIGMTGRCEAYIDAVLYNFQGFGCLSMSWGRSIFLGMETGQFTPHLYNTETNPF